MFVRIEKDPTVLTSLLDIQSAAGHEQERELENLASDVA
jgi:hypothetical protein